MTAPLDYLLGLKMHGISIIFMSMTAAIAILLPVILFLILRKKHGARLLPMLIGAITFVVFALVLEQLFLSLLPLRNLIGVYPTPVGNIVLYAAIGCLAAGIFEETGRFVAIKFVLRKNNSGIDTPLAYGVGHGGIEAILLVGFSMVSLIVSSLMLNSGALGTALKLLPEEQASDQASVFIELAEQNPALFLAGGVERISAVIFHICASVLVWMAVTKPGKLWLYPAAILLHALFNVAAVLYQVGVIENVWLTEGIVFVFALLFAFVLRSRLRSTSDSLPE